MRAMDDEQKVDATAAGDKGKSNTSLDNGASGSNTPTPTTGLRDNLVELAVKFLSNPRVVSSPMEQKKAFLKKKGLTDDEIDKAIQLAKQVPSTSQAAFPSNQVATVGMPPPLPPRPLNPPPYQRSWSEYLVLTALVGGAGYAIFQFIRHYVIPWFEKPDSREKKLNEVHVSIQELHSSVSDTVASVNESTKAMRELLCEQQQHIQLLTTQVSSMETITNQQNKELKEELASLKGLLLSRHQFPPTPTRQGNLGAGIPAWQRTPLPSSSPPNGQKKDAAFQNELTNDEHKTTDDRGSPTGSNHSNEGQINGTFQIEAD